jgi:hypothetical protein
MQIALNSQYHLFNYYAERTLEEEGTSPPSVRNSLSRKMRKPYDALQIIYRYLYILKHISRRLYRIITPTHTSASQDVYRLYL